MRLDTRPSFAEIANGKAKNLVRKEPHDARRQVHPGKRRTGEKAPGDKRIICDAEALADKLTYVIENPQLWAEMGRRARAFVEQHFDIEKLNDRLVEVYRELAGSAGT